MSDITLPPHPSAEALRKFGLGQLDEPEASVVEEHVSHCEACGRTLADVGSDTFVHALRTGGRAPPLADATTALPAADPAVPAATDGKTSAEGASLIELPPELQSHPRYRVLGLLGGGAWGPSTRPSTGSWSASSPSR
jgi:anti-sigma factor RsiW